MPLAQRSFGWQEAALAFAIVTAVAFLVTWVITDRSGVRRPTYVAILTAAVAGLGVGYLAWSGTSFRALVVDGWGWGVGVGLGAGLVAVPLVRRFPSRPHAHGSAFGGQLAWEALVYGIAEGILLAALPTLAIWQAAERLGWTGTTPARVGSGAAAVAGALLVILVHHLGYEEFRSRAARKKLLGTLVTCGIQAIAFLATGNVLAPVIAHIVLHVEILLRGVELPPVTRRRGEAMQAA